MTMGKIVAVHFEVIYVSTHFIKPISKLLSLLCPIMHTNLSYTVLVSKYLLIVNLSVEKKIAV